MPKRPRPPPAEGPTLLDAARSRLIRAWAAVVAFMTWGLYARIRNRTGRPALTAEAFAVVVLLIAAIANAGCVKPAYGRGPAKALASAVRIEAVCISAEGDMATFMGTGVIINATTLLTAEHVADTPEGWACG